MAIPLAPVAVLALKYGTVAALAFVIGKNAKPVPKDAIREKAFDDAQGGVSAYARREPGEVTGHAAAKIRHKIPGVGLDFDAAILARLRFRRAGQGA